MAKSCRKKCKRAEAKRSYTEIYVVCFKLRLFLAYFFTCCLPFGDLSTFWLYLRYTFSTCSQDVFSFLYPFLRRLLCVFL